MKRSSSKNYFNHHPSLYICLCNTTSLICERRVAKDIVTPSVVQKIIGRLEHVVADFVVSPDFLSRSSGEAMPTQRWASVSLQERGNLRDQHTARQRSSRGSH